MVNSDSKKEVALAWWRRFGPANPEADSGAFARLRRASDVVDSLLEPVSIALVQQIATVGREAEIQRVAELAVLLSHIRTNEGAPMASRLGGRASQKAPMSSLRFQKMMKSPPGIERLTHFRRAIALLGNKASVRDLSEAWLYFDHPTQGEALRIDWLLRYAGANSLDVNSELTAPDDQMETGEDA